MRHNGLARKAQVRPRFDFGTDGGLVIVKSDEVQLRLNL